MYCYYYYYYQTHRLFGELRRMSEQDKLRLVVDGQLTVEELRRIRAGQVAAARIHDEKFNGMSPVEEDHSSYGVRPVEQRVRGRERILVGGCVAFWLGLIVLGTLGTPAASATRSHHSLSSHLHSGATIAANASHLRRTNSTSIGRIHY